MDWREENNQLHKTFEFDNFRDAVTWMVRASFEIEQLNHHPEWRNVYNKVEVALCTHDAGNVVTENDRVLAAKLDELYRS